MVRCRGRRLCTAREISSRQADHSCDRWEFFWGAKTFHGTIVTPHARCGFKLSMTAPVILGRGSYHFRAQLSPECHVGRVKRQWTWRFAWRLVLERFEESCTAVLTTILPHNSFIRSIARMRRGPAPCHPRRRPGCRCHPRRRPGCLAPDGVQIMYRRAPLPSSCKTPTTCPGSPSCAFDSRPPRRHRPVRRCT